MGRRSVASRARQLGQALTEFALVSMVLVLILGGCIEFGALYGHKLELAAAARAGTRWAATHPEAWTAASSPGSSTIEGQVQYAGGTTSLANQDSTILIEYLAVSGSTLTLCGHWSASSNAFVPVTGYSQAGCLTKGNLVRVTVAKAYSPLTALLNSVSGPSVTLSASAASVILT